MKLHLCWYLFADGSAYDGSVILLLITNNLYHRFILNVYYSLLLMFVLQAT